MIHLLLNLLISAHAETNPFFEDIQNFKERSLNLQTEKSNLEASEDFLLSKKLFWTPKLSLSLEKSTTIYNRITTSKSDNAKVDLSLNVFNGGGDWNRFLEAKAQNKSQELKLLNANLRIEVTATDLIFKALYIIQMKRIEEQLFKLKEESLKIVKDKYNQGKIPLQEVTKSEVDLFQQKNKLRTAILELSENKSQISSLFVTEIKTSSWPFNEKTSLKIKDHSYYPLAQQKFWSVEAKKQAWNTSKSLHWPSVDLQLQYLEYPLKNRMNNQLIGLVALRFPLWNGFETSAQVTDSYAQYLGALNEYKESEQLLSQRSLYLVEKIETARLNLVESKRNLELSKKLYEDILKTFRLGRISTNDLIIEQNRLLESENNLALGQLTFHQGIVEACTLTGLKSIECLE